MKFFSALAFVSISFLIVSCCSCRKGSPKIGELESARWELIEFKSKPVNDIAISLVFDGEKKMIYGTAPCNNFFAGYSLFENPDQNIKISAVGATRKFCPDSQLENDFTMTLSQVTRIKMESTNMLMLDSQGNLIAVFEWGKLDK